MVFIKTKETAPPNMNINLDSCLVSSEQGRITGRGRIWEIHSVWLWLFKQLLLPDSTVSSRSDSSVWMVPLHIFVFTPTHPKMTPLQKRRWKQVGDRSMSIRKVRRWVTFIQIIKYPKLTQKPTSHVNLITKKKKKLISLFLANQYFLKYCDTWAGLTRAPLGFSFTDNLLISYYM